MDSGIVESNSEIDDDFRRDLDSLYILPLWTLPLKSNLFRRAKMIKDYRLEPAIEVFSNEETGSGRIYLDEIDPENFVESDPEVVEDFTLLTKLGRLQSFDVYSLRMSLRELEIPVRSDEFLSLSREKKDALNERMKVFTQPLLREVYGQSGLQAAKELDIIKLISDPDVDVALGRLRALSELLDIELGNIPKFLGDFSDIYLSLAYYQQCADEIGEQIGDFRDELQELRDNWQLRQNYQLMKACEAIDKTLTRCEDGIQQRFDAFNANTDKMWENVSAERFRKIEAVIKAHHTTIGGILCGVGTKMQSWRTLFPEPGAGGPVARGDAVMSHIVPGIEKILSPLKIMEALNFDFDAKTD